MKINWIALDYTGNGRPGLVRSVCRTRANESGCQVDEPSLNWVEQQLVAEDSYHKPCEYNVNEYDVMSMV